jgi:UDP-N-acetylglucosamine 1-carboxyvinyltransferase
MPDRIEAGSYLVAALLAGGEKGVTIRNSPNFALQSFFEVIRSSGAMFDEVDEHTLFVPPQPRHFTAVEVMTDYYPGFATDLQAQTMLFATQCEGISKIYEKIYENRMMHAAELRNMGAHIDVVNPQLALVQGKAKLSGAHVRCTDLRGGMAVVLAALLAEGYTTVHDVHHVDRGYERLEQKLSALGASIKRVDAEAEVA